MAPVSVYYRVGAIGADPSYLFAGEARDSDLRHAAWLGWLPLTLVEFAAPGVALPGDTWLTAPAGCSEPLRPADSGDVVTALDAAVELIVRRDSGLAASTGCPAAVLVGDDLAAHVDRLRTAHLAVVEGLDGVEQERAVLHACRRSSSGDTPVRRPCGRAVRDLQEEQRRLHPLLEAAVRIRVFDPAVGR